MVVLAAPIDTHFVAPGLVVGAYIRKTARELDSQRATEPDTVATEPQSHRASKPHRNTGTQTHRHTDTQTHGYRATGRKSQLYKDTTVTLLFFNNLYSVGSHPVCVHNLNCIAPQTFCRKALRNTFSLCF